MLGLQFARLGGLALVPMDVGRIMGRTAVLALLVTPLASAGCQSPTAPPEPPGGGQSLNLSFAGYESSVAPVLSRHGCDAGGDCHGGGIRGSLRLSPVDAKDLRADFDQVALQVSASAPEASPILTEPLALDAGGTPHQVKPFATTADSGYLAIRQWILAGVPQ
jgi:hypothetical protein